MLEISLRLLFRKIKKLFNDKRLSSFYLVVINETKPMAGIRTVGARCILNEIEVKSWVMKHMSDEEVAAILIHELCHAYGNSQNHPFKFARNCFKYTSMFFNDKEQAKKIIKKQYWWHNSRNHRADRLCKHYGIFK